MSRDLEEEWSSEYDSTWEEEDAEEERGKKPRGKREPGTRSQPNYRRSWNRAAKDLQNYRHNYSEDKNYQTYSSENAHLKPNLDFYQNKKCFEPNGLFIDDLLEDWKEDYTMLERNHSYIQWLFPLREYGMNSCAKPLTTSEIEAMKKDQNVRKRFLAAYKLMLDFYGIRLENEETGEVSRAENYEERFKNLNYHSHNNLRITRILKCLGELGFGRFQAPLVRFFLEETLLNNKLQNVKRSALDYFMFTVKDKTERRKLVHFVWENYKPKEGFIWGPIEKLQTYQPPAKRVNTTDGDEENGDDDCLVIEDQPPPAKSIKANQESLEMTSMDHRKSVSPLHHHGDVTENLSNGFHEQLQLQAKDRDSKDGEVTGHGVTSDHEGPLEGGVEDQTIEETLNQPALRKRKMPNSPKMDFSITAHTEPNQPSPEENRGPTENDSTKKIKLNTEPYGGNNPESDQEDQCEGQDGNDPATE